MVCNFVKMAASVAGLAMMLTGCAVPPPYVPISYAPPDTWGGMSRTTFPAVSYRPAVPPVVRHTPEPTFEPVPPPDEQPVDPACGWWRLCNLWSGS
jgi:hypothetical protein